MFGIQDAGSLLMIGVVYTGMVLAAFWLAMVIWTYRDMRARSRDSIAHIIVALMVAVLTLPGLLIYLLLRPRETLSEAYERSLEEEALLQEIEEKPVCPACSRRTHESWQACPSCHTRLKKQCAHCHKMLDLSWNLCPYCATSQVGYSAEEPARAGHVRPDSIPEQWSAEEYQTKARTSRTSASSLEFVDTEDY